MNCERIQNSLTDFEAGALPPREAEEIAEHLKTCPNCQREWADVKDTLRKLSAFPEEKPSPRMRAEFYAMLETHARAAARESSHPFAPRRRWFAGLFPSVLLQAAAAVVLVAAGVFAGNRFAGSRENPEDAAATRKEIAELRTRVESMNQLVAYSLAQQQPARARLQNIQENLAAGQQSEQTLAQLLSALAFDNSANVRLSALEALYAHADQPTVRRGVVAALPREPSPLVQVAMIDFLASTREPSAASALQQLAHSPTVNATVRDAAERALALL